jgi:hypothetical protein
MKKKKKKKIKTTTNNNKKKEKKGGKRERQRKKTCVWGRERGRGVDVATRELLLQANEWWPLEPLKRRVRTKRATRSLRACPVCSLAANQPLFYYYFY